MLVFVIKVIALTLCVGHCSPFFFSLEVFVYPHDYIFLGFLVVYLWKYLPYAFLVLLLHFLRREKKLLKYTHCLKSWIFQYFHFPWICFSAKLLISSKLLIHQHYYHLKNCTMSQHIHFLTFINIFYDSVLLLYMQIFYQLSVWLPKLIITCYLLCIIFLTFVFRMHISLWLKEDF